MKTPPTATPHSQPYVAPRTADGHDEVQARLTFLRLLCRPLVTAHQDVGLYREVMRYGKQIDGYCKRLDYRRTHLGGAIRLVRNPVLGAVTAPPRSLEFPHRRVLTLTALLAAACEEVEGGVTLVKLSELVATLSAGTDRALRPYDPDLLAERRALVRAAGTLEFWGVLRKRTTLITDVNDWTENRAGIGAGYDVDREALLLFVTPDTIALAAHQQAQLEQAAEEHTAPGTEPDEDSATAAVDAHRRSTRVVRHLRALVETPTLLYADLPADEAELARTQRGLRAADAVGLIGGTVEARTEGLVWVSREDDCPATVTWPTAKTESWAALMIADKAGRDGCRDEEGVVHLDTYEVAAVFDDLTEWKGHLFRQELRVDHAQLRAAVENTLRWLGLLEVDPDGRWRLSPVAGRYRDPDLIEPAPDAEGDPQLDLTDPTDETPRDPSTDEERQ